MNVYAEEGNVNILGVALPYKLATKDKPLLRNGYAVVNLLGKPGYVGVLYSSTHEKNPENLILSNQPASMMYYFVQDDIAAEIVFRSILEGIVLNNKELIEKKIEEEKMRQLSDLITQPFNAGDVLIFKFSPTTGLTILRNDEILVNWVYGKSFFNMLLRTWIGKFPPSRAFKRAILNFPVES